MCEQVEVSEPIKLAVIEGVHPFDVIAFQRLFRGIPGIDFYPQTIDNWAANWGNRRDTYDALLFYNMNPDIPAEDPVAEVLDTLGDTSQGVVVLHHALLAYPRSSAWSAMVGVADRTTFEYHGDQELTVNVAAPDHPIIRDLDDFTVHEETYVMNEPDGNSEVILTANHPRSMRSIGWTRKYRNARVFNLQLGHDNRVWEHPSFRTIIERGIHWVTGRL